MAQIPTFELPSVNKNPKGHDPLQTMTLRVNQMLSYPVWCPFWTLSRVSSSSVPSTNKSSTSTVHSPVCSVRWVECDSEWRCCPGPQDALSLRGGRIWRTKWHQLQVERAICRLQVSRGWKKSACDFKPPAHGMGFTGKAPSPNFSGSHLAVYGVTETQEDPWSVGIWI